MKIVSIICFKELTAVFMLQAQAPCGLLSSTVLQFYITSTFEMATPAHPPTNTPW